MTPGTTSRVPLTLNRLQIRKVVLLYRYFGLEITVKIKKA